MNEHHRVTLKKENILKKTNILIKLSHSYQDAVRDRFSEKKSKWKTIVLTTFSIER